MTLTHTRALETRGLEHSAQQLRYQIAAHANRSREHRFTDARTIFERHAAGLSTALGSRADQAAQRSIDVRPAVVSPRTATIDQLLRINADRMRRLDAAGMRAARLA